MKKNKKQNTQLSSPPANKHPWQKPRLQQLNVSLDTAFTGGSGADGMFGTTTGP